MSDSCANVGFLIAPLPLFYYFLFVVDTWNEKEKFLLPFAERFFFFKSFWTPWTRKEKNEICSGWVAVVTGHFVSLRLKVSLSLSVIHRVPVIKM